MLILLLIFEKLSLVFLAYLITLTKSFNSYYELLNLFPFCNRKLLGGMFSLSMSSMGCLYERSDI